MEERRTDESNRAAQFIKTDDQAKQLAQVVVKRIDTFNPHRREMNNEINANICYIVGQQNIVLVGNIIKPAPKTRETDEIVNVILPAVQNDVAVATSSPAAYDVVPAGTDEDDRATSIAGQKILPVLQRKLGRDFKRAEAVLWWDISTVGWRKVYYDPNHNVMGINPEPVDEETGQPNPGHNPNFEIGDAIVDGEVQIECIPTNQLIYDYRETNLNKLKWIIHAQRVTANWVADRFGAEVQSKLSSKFTKAGITGEDEFEFNVNQAFNNSMGTQTTFVPKLRSGYEMQLKSDEFIDYYEYWERPSKSMPTGVYCVMLADQVVHHGPYPIEMYPHGELPFIPAAPMNIPGVTNGSISRVSQARPLQRKFNELASQIDENISVMGNAIIMTPRNCKLRHKTLDNGAGNIIEYDGGIGKPTREAGTPMNSQVFAYLNEKKLAIDTLFAFHEPSRGLAPRNIESGKGLQRLQDADTRQQGPIIEAFEEADQRVAYQALTLAITNYPQDKMLNVVGDDYDWTLYKIDKEQLKGKLNVIVRRHSSMPIDKEGEKIQAFNAWSSGLLGDPQDPELRIWTLEQMSIGNNANLLQKHSKQKNFAMKEFVMAEANLKDIQIPPDLNPEETAAMLEQYLFIPHINPFDDHMVHISCHNDYLLSNYWKLKKTGNPLFLELMNRMGMHLQEHQGIIMQQQEAAYQRDLRREMLVKGKTMEQIALSKMNLEPKSNDKPKPKGK